MNCSRQSHGCVSVVWPVVFAPLLVLGLISPNAAASVPPSQPTGVSSGTAISPAPIVIPRASITANDLGVVIAQDDPLSEAIGTYYAQARGIPAANVVRVALTTGVDEISDTGFEVVRAQVDSLLPSGVQATMLTWTQPSRVRGQAGAMSITSALAFGYDAKYTGTCNSTAPSPYYDSNTTTPWTDLQLRPSMMLGASTFTSAKALIDRGVSSEGTYPSGDGFLVRTTDSARSDPRYLDFAPLPALWNHPNGLNLNYIDGPATGQNWITGMPNVLFYFTGLDPQLPTGVPDLATNTFRPGAIGDDLTSFAGVIPNNGSGQQAATAFLDAGATASYGTVEEPCAYADKFPRASVVIDQYYRGATLIEAYWKSVRTPGQGLFLGEPLARPFADQLSSTVQGNEYVISTRSFRHDSRFEIQYRTGPTSPWMATAELVTGPSQPVTWRAPLAPNGAEARLVGPCPAAALKTAGTARAQGGRMQSVYLQLSIDEGAGGCGPDSYDLSVEPLADGLSATLDASSLRSFSAGNPGPTQYAVLQVLIPATVGQSTSTTESVYIDMKNRRTGQVTRTLRTILVSSSTTTTPFLAPAVRISRPGSGWVLTDDGARPYQVPVHLDVAPTSGINRVRLSFTSASASGCCSYQTMAYGPGFTAQIPPDYLQPGVYYLTAIGEDANGQQIGLYQVGLTSDFALAGPTGTINLEAELGVLTGRARIASSATGYTGTGYVTGLASDADYVTMPFTVPTSGSYAVLVRYRTPFGEKYGNLTQNNDNPIALHLAATDPFATVSGGTLSFPAGANTLRFGGNWSYYDIDSIELRPVATAPSDAIHVEAEAGALFGAAVSSTATGGYAGSGYVTALRSEADFVTMPITVPTAGTYEAFVRYRTPFGLKYGTLTLDNNAPVNVRLEPSDVFATTSSGRMDLPAGTHTARFGGNWSWYEIDYIEFRRVG